MSEQTRRVDFNAPESLVERADQVRDLLGVSRTQLLIDALESELASITDNPEFRERVRAAYYAGEIEADTVEAVLGREEAARTQLLRQSIDRAVPDPQIDGDLPAAEPFYDGPVPEWTPAGDDGAGTDSEP
jgi:hypothetical protein